MKLQLTASRRNCDPEIRDPKHEPHQELMAEFKSVVEELAKLPTGRTLILVSEGFYIDTLKQNVDVEAERWMALVL